MLKCTRCPAYKNSKNINYYEGVGNLSAKFMFVGECFGRTECQTGIPFSGDSGKFLDECLELINLKRKDIYITNAVRCYTENKIPTKEMVNKCFIHLQREIQQVNPELIIALGSTAFTTLTEYNSEEFKFYRGKTIMSEKINKKIYTLYHPAAQLHDPTKKEKFIEEFKRTLEMLSKKAFKRKNYSYTLVNSNKEFDKMFKILYNNTLGIDIETEGLDSYNETLNIRTLQLGKDKDNIFVITKNIVYSNLKKLKELIESCKIIGQDFAFDIKWIFNRLDIFPKLWEHDSCLAEFLICGMKNNSLNDLVPKYNPDYHNYWLDIQNAGGAHKIQDVNKLYQYAANDIGTLFPIMRKQQKTLFRTNQYDYFKNIMMPCNKVLTKMSLRGVHIDIKTLKELDIKYKKRGEKSLFSAQTLPGVKECEAYFSKKFNPRSVPMVRWLLLEYYKLPVLKKTKASKMYPNGQPKISQKEMEIYAEQYNNKYCKIMEKYRSINTIRKNFLSGSIPKLKNGIAHTKYSLHATATSRPNSRDPNLLNLPSKKEYLDVKKCYTARDGFVLLVADKAQIEVRVASVMYYDKNLIALCNEPERDDFHSLITSRVFHKTYDEIYNAYKAGDKEATDKRRICKSITFGILYGMGEEKLAYQMGVSLNEAKRFIRDYFDMFPDLEREIENAKKFVVKHGYIDTYFKFRRYFLKHSWEDHDTLREAVNTVIQGTAWNLMQLSLINIDKKLEENKMESGIIMQVYDSVVVETERSEIKEVAKIIKPTMENINKPYPILNEVKIKTDVEIGKSLYGLEKYI